MKKDLPIYDIKLSDDTQGVGFISLVDEPAIGVDWIKLAKQEVEEPIELFMSLTGDGLCFGCPPNGDGTRVNGEPDARCKGDGSGKTGGSKGGGSAKSSVPVYEERTTIKDPAEIEKVLAESKSNTKPEFDKTPNTKDYKGEPLREISKDELAKQIEYEIKEPTLIFTTPTSERSLDKPDMVQLPGREGATQMALYNLSGSWIDKSDIKDFLDGRMSVQRGDGTVFAMTDSKFKMSKVVKSMMARKSPKSIMAKKAVGTLDGSGCFGCPPNGDGTRVNGEPDARCKGDGSAKGGSKPVAKATPKATTKSPVDAKAKELKDAQKTSEKASQKIVDATFENPPTSIDHAAISLPKAVADAQFWRDFHSRGLANNSELSNAERRLERVKSGSRDEDIKKANTSYDEIVEKEISKLPNPYDAKPSYVNEDKTWDYKKGQPKDTPKGKKRALNYERRSGEDVLEGYPQYKIYIDWE